jgi:hypothetical protein
MIIAVVCAAIILSACLRTRSAWTRLDAEDLRRLKRRSEEEYREQIHPFE